MTKTKVDDEPNYNSLLFLSSNFPTRRKKLYAVPIFKSGFRSDIEGFREDVILPTFGKFIESVISFKPVLSSLHPLNINGSLINKKKL